MDKTEKVNAYYAQEHVYDMAIAQLRKLALSTEVEETYKWQFPTYTVNGKNVFAICRFKGHFGIWFFNGVDLSDPLGVLQNAQEGKTKAMRHWKFFKEGDMDKTQVLAYMQEAIENQKQGKTTVAVKSKKTRWPIPTLLKEALGTDPALESAFKSLTPYKQNEYSEYISEAKQEKTKHNRLKKIRPLILECKGLNDKYR